MYTLVKSAINAAIICSLYVFFAAQMQMQISYQCLFALGLALFLIYQADAYIDAQLGESPKHILRQKQLNAIQIYMLPIYVVLTDISLASLALDITYFRIAILMALIGSTWAYYAFLPYFKKNNSIKNCFSSWLLVSGLPLISNSAYTNVNSNTYIYAGIFFLLIWLNFEWIDMLYKPKVSALFIVKVLIICFIFLLCGYYTANVMVYAFLPIFVYYLCYTFYISTTRIKELFGDMLHVIPFILQLFIY